MRNAPDLLQAQTFVRHKFAGSLDKGGEPYVNHCLRVMERLPDWCGQDEWHAALLHDVLEDTDTTAADLRAFGFTERTIWLVERLTRPVGPDRPTYMDYIRSIAESGDKSLVAIKLADNADNSDPSRITQLPASERDIAKRYERARRILEKPRQPA